MPTAHDFGTRPSKSAPSSPRLGLKTSLYGGQNGETRLTSPLAQPNGDRNFHPDASIVLVGIRGSGKRSLGLIAAAALGRRFITEDFYFQSITGLSRQEFLKVHGSEEFHKQDVDITRQMLEDNMMNCVIDCGLGSMTSSLQDYLKQYRQKNPVIYLMRDMNQIKALLNLSDRSTRMLAAGAQSHRKCSNYEYYNLQESASNEGTTMSEDRDSSTYSFKLRKAQEDFSHFVRLITGKLDKTSVSPFSMDKSIQNRVFTYALQLPLAAYEKGIDMEELLSAGDAVEVIVDRWNSATADATSKLVATVRRHLAVPIIFTVRPASADLDWTMNALIHGLRLAVDWLSLDLGFETTVIQQIRALKGRTKIIGTYTPSNTHDITLDSPGLKQTLMKAHSMRCDAVRILAPSTSDTRLEDAALLTGLRASIKAQGILDVPLIMYNTGSSGRMSQIFNPTLTGVSHMALSRQEPATPMLTARDATKALFDCFVYDPLTFYIVGGNVTQSLSPYMHHAAYAHLGLQHSYKTKDITSWADIEELAANEYFGGASIVQPWKVRVVQKAASLSEHAKAIGASNTLMPLRVGADGKHPSVELQASSRNRGGKIIGWHAENTDWLGIKVCVTRSLSPRNVIQSKTTGLVIGAGGMARAAIYALLQMGCKHIFLYNRTVANARSVAAHFEDWLARTRAPSDSHKDKIIVLESLEQDWPEAFSMPTIVISCVTHEVLDGNPGANFQMPSQWLQSPSGGVAVEMAYMTSCTALIKQIRDYRQTTGLPWVIIDGIETLIEQAMGQFEIMTGKKAPRKVMTSAIRAVLRENRQYVADGEVYGV